MAEIEMGTGALQSGDDSQFGQELMRRYCQARGFWLAVQTRIYCHRFLHSLPRDITLLELQRLLGLKQPRQLIEQAETQYSELEFFFSGAYIIRHQLEGIFKGRKIP